jgi:hypothetical protein
MHERLTSLFAQDVASVAASPGARWRAEAVGELDLGRTIRLAIDLREPIEHVDDDHRHVIEGRDNGDWRAQAVARPSATAS